MQYGEPRLLQESRFEDRKQRFQAGLGLVLGAASGVQIGQNSGERTVRLRAIGGLPAQQQKRGHQDGERAQQGKAEAGDERLLDLPEKWV